MFKHFFERSGSSQSIFGGLLEQIKELFFVRSEIEHTDGLPVKLSM
jgi:hypothetical protein